MVQQTPPPPSTLPSLRHDFHSVVEQWGTGKGFSTLMMGRREDILSFATSATYGHIGFPPNFSFSPSSLSLSVPPPPTMVYALPARYAGYKKHGRHLLTLGQKLDPKLRLKQVCGRKKKT